MCKTTVATGTFPPACSCPTRGVKVRNQPGGGTEFLELHAAEFFDVVRLDVPASVLHGVRAAGEEGVLGRGQVAEVQLYRMVLRGESRTRWWEVTAASGGECGPKVVPAHL